MNLKRVPIVAIDTAVFLGGLGSVLLFFWFWGHTLYAQGRDPIAFLGSSLLAFFGPLAAFALIVVAMVFVMVGWTIWRALAGGWRAIPIRLGLLALVVALACSGALTPDFGRNHPFLHGFADWIHEEADLDALRQWLVRQPAPATGTSQSERREIPRESWPPEIAKLSPGMVWIEGRSSADQVVLSWGVGFESWGLVVCRQPIQGTDRDEDLLLRLDERTFLYMSH
jgi:hypothetical protein